MADESPAQRGRLLSKGVVSKQVRRHGGKMLVSHRSAAPLCDPGCGSYGSRATVCDSYRIVIRADVEWEEHKLLFGQPDSRPLESSHTLRVQSRVESHAEGAELQNVAHLLLVQYTTLREPLCMWLPNDNQIQEPWRTSGLTWKDDRIQDPWQTFGLTWNDDQIQEALPTSGLRWATTTRFSKLASCHVLLEEELPAGVAFAEEHLRANTKGHMKQSRSR